jgi:hypothetical protein
MDIKQALKIAAALLLLVVLVIMGLVALLEGRTI